MPTLVASALLTALWFSPSGPAVGDVREHALRGSVSVGGEWQARAAPSRPVVLVPMYVALGAFHGLDIYSTSRAIRAGARESNPFMAPLGSNVVTLSAVKVVSVASTVYFVERLWRRHKVGAVVVMAALNGMVAAVSMHNARVTGRMRPRD